MNAHRSAATCTSCAQHYFCCALDFGATGAAATVVAATAAAGYPATAAVAGGDCGGGAEAALAPGAFGPARFEARCSWVAWPSGERTLWAKFIGPCIDTLSLPMLRRRSRQHTPLSGRRGEHTHDDQGIPQCVSWGVGQSSQASARTSRPGTARSALGCALPRVRPRWSSSSAR